MKRIIKFIGFILPILFVVSLAIGDLGLFLTFLLMEAILISLSDVRIEDVMRVVEIDFPNSISFIGGILSLISPTTILVNRRMRKRISPLEYKAARLHEIVHAEFLFKRMHIFLILWAFVIGSFIDKEILGGLLLAKVIVPSLSLVYEEIVTNREVYRRTGISLEPKQRKWLYYTLYFLLYSSIIGALMWLALG